MKSNNDNCDGKQCDEKAIPCGFAKQVILGLQCDLKDAKDDASRGFADGVMYCAAILVSLYDRPEIAADIIKEAGLSDYDCGNLDDFEKDRLRSIRKYKGLSLKGLNKAPQSNQQTEGE